MDIVHRIFFFSFAGRFVHFILMKSNFKDVAVLQQFLCAKNYKFRQFFTGNFYFWILPRGRN